MTVSKILYTLAGGPKLRLAKPTGKSGTASHRGMHNRECKNLYKSPTLFFSVKPIRLCLFHTSECASWTQPPLGWNREENSSQGCILQLWKGCEWRLAPFAEWEQLCPI
uniref:Uncharacterized protein n=1 Tax=Sphaerodactylus townsendi TaxID=933632 RepID=A0ACB8EMX2_9SAUR